MEFTINDNEYKVKFGFRTCVELKKVMGSVNTQDDAALVDMVFDKGAKLVHTAIKSNKLKPIPSIDQIEDFFDEQVGFGTDFLLAALQGIGLHVTPTRTEEIESAAKGN